MIYLVMPEHVDTRLIPVQVMPQVSQEIRFPPAPPELGNTPKARLQEFSRTTINDSYAVVLLSEAAHVDLSAMLGVASHSPDQQQQAVSQAFLSLRRQCPTIWDIGTALQGAEHRIRYGQGQTIRTGPAGGDPVMMANFQRANNSIGKFAQEVYLQYGTPVSDQTKTVILDKFNTWALGHRFPDQDFYVREMANCAAAQNLTQQEAAAVLRGVDGYKKLNYWPTNQYSFQDQAAYARFAQSLTRLQLVAAGHASGGGQVDRYELVANISFQVKQEHIEPVESLKPQEQALTKENAVDKAWALAQRNPSAKDLLSMLKQRKNNWSDAAISSNPGLAATMRREDVSDIVEWITQSSDWEGWADINRVLERDIVRNVDARGLGTQYRQSRDELIDAVAPYIALNKTPPIPNELSAWENSTGKEGGRCLVDRTEMHRKYQFQRVERGKFVFYTAVNQNMEPILNRFEDINNRLVQTLGTDYTKRVHVVLVPEAKYCPRGGYAKPDGTGFILAPSQDIDQVYAHEAAHVILGQVFGISNSATASEGAAMYLARVVNPQDQRNDYVAQRYGDDQIVKIRGNGGQIGLSHTQMLDVAHEPRSKADYEYAYKFGGLLAEYICSKVGVEGYLRFYQRTCLSNLYDSDTGKALIVNGKKQAGVGEREINAQALKAMAAQTGRPDMRPENILQEFSAFAAARNAKGAF